MIIDNFTKAHIESHWSPKLKTTSHRATSKKASSSPITSSARAPDQRDLVACVVKSHNTCPSETHVLWIRIIEMLTVRQWHCSEEFVTILFVVVLWYLLYFFQTGAFRDVNIKRNRDCCLEANKFVVWISFINWPKRAKHQKRNSFVYRKKQLLYIFISTTWSYWLHTPNEAQKGWNLSWIDLKHIGPVAS